MANPQTRIIYVSGLCPMASDTDVKRHFDGLGTVCQVKIIRDYAHRRTGHAYVEMETHELALSVSKKKDGTLLGTKYINCVMNRSQQIEDYFKEDSVKKVQPIVIPEPVVIESAKILKPEIKKETDEYYSSYYTESDDPEPESISEKDSSSSSSSEDDTEKIKNRPHHRRRKVKKTTRDFYEDIPDNL